VGWGGFGHGGGSLLAKLNNTILSEGSSPLLSKQNSRPSQYSLTYSFAFTSLKRVNNHSWVRRIMSKPLLRWAGGKSWLIRSTYDYRPPNIQTYIEPFLGGGAIFFGLEPNPFLIADANEELINCYKSIRDEPVKTLEKLKEHHRKHSKEHYYKTRDSSPRTRVTRAARFVYLNRACFNGLYRVNSKGKFNVPKGTSEKIVLDSDNFVQLSKVLRTGEIKNQDFEKTIGSAGKGDFIFVDPPYTVKHDNNGFVQYNENIFTWQDQERLRDAVCEAGERGAQVTITNANHDSIRELYKDQGEIQLVSRNSLIAGHSSNRGKAKELLIRIGWKSIKQAELFEKQSRQNGIYL